MKILGDSIKSLLWQEKPANCKAAIRRHSHNPVIGRNPAPGIAQIFNSTVVPWKDGFIGVFRTETVNDRPHLSLGTSNDGIKWTIDPTPLPFIDENGDEFSPRYAYDPRVVKVEETYYIIWRTDFYGAVIGLAETQDFKTFVRRDNPFLPYNRNGILFPSDSGHTSFGDIFLSESPDLTYWGRHRHVMTKGGQ